MRNYLILRDLPVNKIINDPVHGFIEIPRGLILDLIDTPLFQRLRRIRQLALSSNVYPGAVHSRFNHCIGALHLTREAMDVLRAKEIEITDGEYESASAAILLHDIGHGPFSHALENVILQGLHHERMSLAMINKLNGEFGGRLSVALQIFEGSYHKPFLHQLVSGQLDMDRMDYLVRDSYFTGVVEGLVATDRIIKTLNVKENRLVVESKGIYSVEKFLVARRLMYWQVYLHRAVIASEYMMVNILKRAKDLMYQQKRIWSNDLLDFFFRLNQITTVGIDNETILRYSRLDDEDILYAIKQWSEESDFVLRTLCLNLLRRKLLKVELDENPIDEALVESKRVEIMSRYGIGRTECQYLVFCGTVSNLAYLKGPLEPITILHKDGSLEDITTASDMENIDTLSRHVSKHFFCFPGPDF